METAALDIKDTLKKTAGSYIPTLEGNGDVRARLLKGFESMKETMYLFSSPANISHLLQSKEQLEHGHTHEIPLAQLAG